MAASSVAPKRGTLGFRDLNPTSRLHDGHKYSHNGAWPSPASYAPADSGPKQGSSPLLAAPWKVPISREKGAGVHDARPLGAGMDSSGFFSQRHEVLPQRGHGLRRNTQPITVFFALARSTATTGAWPSPASCAAADSSPCKRSWPLARPPGKARLAGEKPARVMMRALWGQQWTRLLVSGSGPVC
jgi:hypothetical protein